jgi:undecaprenyl-diphosphatase
LVDFLYMISVGLKVVILGAIEGITEFLPISSTGHLIVATALLEFNQLNGTFVIFIQLGAVLAVVGFYRVSLWQQFSNIRTDSNAQHLWLTVVVACIPTAFFGFLLRDWIKAVLFDPLVVAIALIGGGIAFLLVERRSGAVAENEVTSDLSAITYKQALAVGFAQLFALIPGVSRSGASIISGLWGGMNRNIATQFSFYLAIPTLGGATVIELLTSFDQLGKRDLVALVVGAVISGIVAWVSISWLLRYVTRNSFVVFGYYRIFAGLVILLLLAVRVL